MRLGMAKPVGVAARRQGRDVNGFVEFGPAELATICAASKLNTMIAAFVWHWWIAPLLVGSVVLFILASVGGYLAQVTKDRYPHREARRD